MLALLRTARWELTCGFFKERFRRYQILWFSTNEDNELFLPSGTNPGVFNVGGTEQGCYDADAIVIADFQAMLAALDEIPLPPRYAVGDRLLRQAIEGQIRGLQLWNKAIAEDDQAAWEHQTVLQESTPLLQQAWEAFPMDNRPQPAP